MQQIISFTQHSRNKYLEFLNNLPNVNKIEKQTQVVFSVKGVNFCWITLANSQIQICPSLGNKDTGLRKLQYKEKKTLVVNRKTGNIDAQYKDPSYILQHKWQYPGFLSSKISFDYGCSIISQAYHIAKVNIKNDVSKVHVNSVMQRKDSLIPEKSKIITLRKDLARIYRMFPVESKIRPNNRDPYRCVILFFLSNGIRDNRLNKVTEALFRKYPNLESFMEISRNQLLVIIKSLGNQNRNTDYIIEFKKKIKKEFNKTIPNGETDYKLFKGFGEKIWECVLAYGFEKNGLPIDSNAMRVFNSIFGVDFELNKVRKIIKQSILPKKWIDTHELLRLHGLTVCLKQNPICNSCPIINCSSRISEFIENDKYLKRRLQQILKEWEIWRKLICSC